MPKRYLEARHQVTMAQRIVDVRPTSSIYAEWLSRRLNMLAVVIPQILLMFVVPILAPVVMLSVLLHLTIHRVSQPTLPFEWPIDTKSDKGKAGKGIFYLGTVDSDSEYEQFKQIWWSDDTARKHVLILGSTGSGKSETLKGLFFNALCWTSGYFVADGKADNKLPTDSHIMLRSMGRDDDALYLNFLLGGKTPEQVRRSRRRRTNKINPVSAADADTIIQMGANMLPKVEGDGKNWQEKALNLWRAVIQALCYIRDTEGMDLSISTIIDYLALPKVEELYIKGYEESIRNGEWSYGFEGIKAYLATGCPSFKVEKLLAKHGYGDAPAAPSRPGAPAQGGKAFEQDNMASEQHSYRTTQLMPVLNLLDKTYGFIFRDKYPEIDMIDVTLNNRILVMLIPSLEKSSQEAENLGKLAIACLRVMMGKNLGAEIEGTRRELLTSKATNAPYPYLVALDELAYYFADGIAVMFAQARSLGFCMIAAAQDLEKLTEGPRAAEAGAMLANTTAKLFMRLDDPKKTWEFVASVVGKIFVPVRRTFKFAGIGVKKDRDIDLVETERVTLQEMQSKGAGEAALAASGTTQRMKSFYVGKDLEDHATDDFWVLRFLQVEPPSDDEIDAHSIPKVQIDNPIEKGERLLEYFRYERKRSEELPPASDVIDAVAAAAQGLGPGVRAAQRAAILYQAAKAALQAREALTGSPTADPAALDAAPGSSGRPEKKLSAGARLLAPSAAPVDLSANASTNAASSSGKQVPELDPLYDDELRMSQVGSGGVSQQALDEDPLAFLSMTPFERKPAEALLGPLDGADRAIHASIRSEGLGFDEALPPTQGGKESAGAGADSGRSPIVMNIIRSGRSLSISTRYQSESRGPVVEGGEAVAMRTLADIRPSELHSIDDASWVIKAYGDAKDALVDRSERGQSVVGFVPETSKQVTRIEKILGSKAPEESSRRLETVVSAKLTPAPTPDAGIDLDDLDAFFNKIDDAAKSGDDK